MENKFLLTDDMLWDYADGFLEEGEIRQVEAYLQQHPEQRQRLESIQAEKRAFAALPLDKPNKSFADGVMAAWVAEQASSKKLAPAKPRDWILLSLGGFMGLLLLGALFLVPALAPSLEPVTMPEQYMPQMPAIDWTTILESAVLRYGLILMLVVLALQILDKYLQQRSQLQKLTPGH